MGRIRTVEPGGKLVSFIGSLRLLTETEGLLQKVEVRLLNSEVNRNNWQYLNLEEHRRLFADTPLLVAYRGKKVGDGHNFDEVQNPDGTVTASFMSATAERIVVWFKADSDIRIETIDNIKWIVGTGYIWKWYAQELVAKLNGQGDGKSDMSVSIETLIEEMHVDDRGTEVFTKYQILGTTILGDEVAPAVKDASIRALSAIGADAIHEMTLRVASANPQPGDGENKPAEPENKPDSADIKLRGVYNMNTRRVKELEPLFPGFRVLAATDTHAALCSEDGELFHVSYKIENGEILPGAKIALDAVCVLGEGDAAVPLSLNDMREIDRNKIADLTAKLNDAETASKNANDTLADMKKRENARREKAVRDAIKARLAEVRENSDADLAENACDGLLTDEKIAEYATMETSEGEFCGDVAACKDVDSLCMAKVIEAAKKKRENAAHRFAFDTLGAQGDQGGDDLDKLIERIQA